MLKSVISVNSLSILVSQKSMIWVEVIAGAGIGAGAWLMFIVHPCKFCSYTPGKVNIPG